MILVARLFSIAFKIAGVACFVFAVVAVRTVIGECIDPRPRLYCGPNTRPDLYTFYLFVAALIPSLIGLVSLCASFLLDLWVIARLNHLLLQTIARRVGEFDV